MWIMVSGPYTAGGADEAQRQANLDAMNRAALALRIGGPSRGADDEVAAFAAAGKPVYRDLADVPAP